MIKYVNKITMLAFTVFFISCGDVNGKDMMNTDKYNNEEKKIINTTEPSNELVNIPNYNIDSGSKPALAILENTSQYNEEVIIQSNTTDLFTYNDKEEIKSLENIDDDKNEDFTITLSEDMYNYFSS